MLRPYAKYLRQAGIPFSQDYMEDTLVAHPAIARRAGRAVRGTASIRRSATDAVRRALDGDRVQAIDHALDDGRDSLDEDRILRAVPQRWCAAACAPTTSRRRTRSWSSFKLDSRTIDELPAPRPLFEIFVYSPRVEGIHLRGGKVARGGIRWSDRREDFRTEILGLMKAQMVKNAVIVPIGSKGGFVVKRPPADEARTRERSRPRGSSATRR